MLKLLHQFDLLTKNELKNIVGSFKLAHYSKGDFIIQVGDPQQDVYFLSKGLLRSFTYSNQPIPEAITHGFYEEGQFPNALNTHSPSEISKISMEALEVCTVLSISSVDLENLYDQIPGLNAVNRQLAQLASEHQEQLGIMIRMQPAQRRYEYFQRHFSNLAARLPEKLKASFLNISASELSRIRKKISIGTTFYN